MAGFIVLYNVWGAAAQLLSLKQIIALNSDQTLVNTNWPDGRLTGPLWRAEGAVHVNTSGSLAVLVGVVMAGQLMSQLRALMT